MSNLYNLKKGGYILEKQQRDTQLREAMDLYGNYLLRLAYTYVKSKEKAEDIVQEVFIRYYIQMEQFEGRSSVKTYLYRMVVNECHNYFKSWAYRKTELTSLFKKHDTSVSVESEILKKEEIDVIADTITTLETKYREVLWLYYYDELSVNDIALVLQCSVNTVKTRLARGRKRVGIQLEKEGFYNGNEFT